jgi:hypothetical protein
MQMAEDLYSSAKTVTQRLANFRTRGFTTTTKVTSWHLMAIGLPIWSLSSGKPLEASVTTLSFDALATGYNSVVPNGYGGFQWTNFYVVNGVGYPGPSGYNNGVVSGPNVAINGNGNLAELSSSSPFILQSGYLTGAWNEGLLVELKGYAGNILLYDNTYTTHATQHTFFNFGYVGVDRVDFTSSGGYSYYSTGTQFVLDNLGVSSSITPLIWNDAGGNGDGLKWDTSTVNWNDGAGITTFRNQANGSNGENVVFNDSNNGNYGVTVNAAVVPGTIAINTKQAYTFSGVGSIGGMGGLTLGGTGAVTISNTGPNLWGNTTVNAGTLNIGSSGALPANQSLTIASGAVVVAANHGTAPVNILRVQTLTNSGTLDLANNALIIHAGATVASVTAQVRAAYNGGAWNGSNIGGISANLTALGIATGLSSFEGSVVAPTDILVKYSYYGDANLDGKVDASDYTLIDNGYLQFKTGWANGDFNYDSVVNASDYTLIDNAFNTQGATLASRIGDQSVNVTAEIANAALSVPEPNMFATVTATALLALRVRRHRCGSGKH